MEISTLLFQWDIHTVLIFTVTLLVGLYLRYGRRQYPPGPGFVPFIGSTLWFIRLRKDKKRLGRAIYAESKKCGSRVIRLAVGDKTVIFIHGYDLIHELFVKQSTLYSKRPPYLPSNKYVTREGRGIVWQSGHAWKILRKFTLQSLRDFGLGKTSLEQNVFDEVEAATDYLKDTAGKPADFRAISSMMIANVIYRIVFGKRFDYKDEEFHEVIEHLDGLFKTNALAAADRTPAFIKKFVNPQQVREAKEREQIFEWIRRHVYAQIDQHEATYEDETVRDFIDLYIAEKKSEENKDIFSVGNIFRIILDLFIAGSETTSNTINWAILYMIEYPDCQRRCQEEIAEQLGNKPISWADRGKLPFVEATLLEIQRMANIAELSLPHTNDEDTYIDGYFIPKHCIVQANLFSSNMDPKHWDEPQLFNPDRFIEQGKLKKNPALIPFSIGPRVCLGESLARLELFLIFSNLIQRFNFKREHAGVANSFESRHDQATGAPLDYMARAITRT